MHRATFRLPVRAMRKKSRFTKVIFLSGGIWQQGYIFCLLGAAIRFYRAKAMKFHGQFRPLIRHLKRKGYPMRNLLSTQFGLFTFGLVFSIALQSAPVLAQTGSTAQAKPDVETILTSKKVSVGADKKEVLSDAATVKPGELIEYRATYTNKAKTPVGGLIATLPIPAGTEYQGGTAVPKGATASLGDGKFAPIPLKRKVKLPDGKEVERDVPLTEYKSLQWSLGELAAGKSVVVSARVRVTDVTPIVSATPASATPPPPSSSGGQK